MERLRRNQLKNKGSLTVEAALALPIFMAFMLLISSIARGYYLHEIMQHALADAVNEVASSAYIYSVTGLMDVRNEVHDTFTETGQVASDDFDLLVDCLDIAKQGTESAKALDASGVSESYEAGTEAAGSLAESLKNVADDPEQYAKSVVSLMLASGMEKAEQEIMNQMIKGLMYKHIRTDNLSADDRLKNLHVLEGMGGLSFEGSTYFQEGEDLEVYVTYTLSRVDPFGLIKNVSITNHVKARAWISGDVESSDGSESEVEGIRYPNTTMYLSGSSDESGVFHFSKDCKTNSHHKDWQECVGTYIDIPGTLVDQFEYNGKTYHACKVCANGNEISSNEDE